MKELTAYPRGTLYIVSCQQVIIYGNIAIIGLQDYFITEEY